MNKRLIFNSSMPRSGSELLQVLLHQNPEIYASPTSPVYGFFEGVRNHMGTPEVKSWPAPLMRAAQLGFCREGMKGFYSAITPRGTICDKSRAWIGEYEWLSSILGEKPKIVCMVRDLREVCVSQELVWRNNRHLSIGNANTLDERLRFWLTESHIAKMLASLADADRRGVLDDILFVRYEDLTTHPAETMGLIYEYLDMTPYVHDFEEVVKQVEEDHTHHGPFGNHDVKPQVRPAKKRYKEVLGRQASENIVNSNSWFFNKFYD